MYSYRVQISGSIPSLESKLEKKKQHRSLSKQLCCKEIIQDIILNYDKIMRKYRYFSSTPIFFIFFGLIVLSFGCSKETIQKDNILPEMGEVTLLDGRIVFPSEEYFDAHIKWIFENQLNGKAIKSYYSDLGFKSMNDYYREGLAMMDKYEDFIAFVEKYPRVFEPVTYPDGSVLYECEGLKLHAYFANKDGIYQIGDKICRIALNAYYEIANGDASLIPKLFLDPENIKEQEIYTEVPSIDSKRTQYYYAINNFTADEEHRLVSRHYKTTVGYPRYYYVRSTAQKKGLFGIWVQEDISNIHVSWTDGYYYFTSGGPIHYVSAWSATNYNDSDVDILVQMTDLDIDFATSYLYTTHSGTRSSVFRTRSLDAW